MSTAELVRLTKDDYDQLIPLLNHVFSIAHNNNSDFERNLPKMCIRDDEHMGKHFGIRKNGKIVSAIGVYPLPAVVAGQKVMFSTMGNLVTLPEEEGNGYMSLLLDEAMKELDKIGADAVRLCGNRQRYNRYGYEASGWLYDFTLCHYNTKYIKEESNISFVPVSKDDTDKIEKMKEINEKNLFYVDRDNLRDFYLAAIAWNHKPYVAVRPDGEVVGYISVSQDNKEIAEHAAVSPAAMKEMLVQWVKINAVDVHFKLMPHMIEEIEIMSAFCDDYYINSPSRFKIINFAKVIDAFFKLKATYTVMPDVDFVVEIEDYGSVHLKCKNNVPECTYSNEKSDIKMTKLEATRFFFDPSAVYFKQKERETVLPLPLSWNLQDRV